jgi:hypothetical protein
VDKVSFWTNENVLRSESNIMVVGASLYSENHGIVHFKMGKFYDI